MKDKILSFFGMKSDSKGSPVIRFALIGFLILLLWASIFQIDQTITAIGQVIASDRTQVVQSADGGVLSKLNVKEGDKVQKGQIVAVLEKNRANAAYLDALGKVAALKMTYQRLQSEITGKIFIPDSELSKQYPDLANVQVQLYKQRRLSLLEQTKQLSANYDLAIQELAMNEPLLKSGDVSRAELLRLRRVANEIYIQKITLQNKYLQDANTELSKTRDDLSTQEQILADKEQTLEHTDLVAPEDGVIKNIKITTLGAFVRQGEEVMQILPTNSELVVEAKIKPGDMANIVDGMYARVKLDAYDYSIFGVMEGKVFYISPDSLSEESRQGPDQIFYRVRIKILNSQLKVDTNKKIEVRPGMTASVDLLGNKRSVLSYLTKPLTKTLNQSLSEK